MQAHDFWQDKTVLITGGSAGLGLGLATALKDYGAKVGIVARNAARVQAVAAAFGIVGIVGDVARKTAIHRISGEATARLGPIDVLVNNASSLGPVPLRLLADTDCEDLEAALAAGLVGPFRLTKALLPNMLLTGRGLVVNISSDAAVSAYERWGAYSITKAALDHMTRVFAVELSGEGVRFLAVDPGEMATQMHADAVPDAATASLADPRAVGRQLAIFLANAGDVQGVRFDASEWQRLASKGELS